HKWGGADGPPRRQEGRIRWIPQELDPGRAVGHAEVRVAPIDATVHHPDDDTSSSRANKAPIGLPGTHLVCSDLRSTQIKERAIALGSFDRTDGGMVGKPLNLVEGDRERDDVADLGVQDIAILPELLRSPRMHQDEGRDVRLGGGEVKAQMAGKRGQGRRGSTSYKRCQRGIHLAAEILAQSW